jgi:hypothetical protein
MTVRQREKIKQIDEFVERRGTGKQLAKDRGYDE